MMSSVAAAVEEVVEGTKAAAPVQKWVLTKREVEIFVVLLPTALVFQFARRDAALLPDSARTGQPRGRCKR